MALTYSSLRTFAEVEHYYNSIKPLGGAKNKGKDIRPIGDRARKWERIVKISPNCYALSDGYHMGDEHFGGWPYGLELKPTLADMEKYAPIVWRKKRNGTEEVTLRNGFGPYQHNSRYQFLYRHTPKGMWFRNRNGKHFIQAGQTDYYLAKVRTAPRAHYERVMKGDLDTYWTRALKKWVMVHDDNSAVTLTNVQGVWMHVDGGKPIPVPPRNIVDVDAKKHMKADIAAFRDWGEIMWSMIGRKDFEYQRRLREEVKEWGEENGFKMNHYSLRLMFDIPELCRNIIKDDQHPLRLHLAISVFDDIDGYDLSEERSARMARFNNRINKICGFIKTVKG
jgi:hypothetical protein